MKKKIRSAKRTTTKKSIHHTTHRSTEQFVFLPFSFRRVILITTCIALVLLAFVFFNKPKITQSVAGISVARGLFAQATIQLPEVTEAVSYNVYYRKVAASDYSNAAWEIPAGTKSYTISYLKKGEAYVYKIAAVDASGAEFSWSEEKNLENIESM